MSFSLDERLGGTGEIEPVDVRPADQLGDVLSTGAPLDALGEVIGDAIPHGLEGQLLPIDLAIEPDEVDAIGEQASEHPLISHCYFRPSPAVDWPYELYTMIHGRHEDEYKGVVAELQRTTPLTEFAVLESLREMKKTSMVYFP